MISFLGLGGGGCGRSPPSPPSTSTLFQPLKSAVEAAAGDRGFGDIAKDLEIKAKITADVIDKMGSDVVSTNAGVYEQNVMLTGSVETAKQKSQAGALAKATDNVKKVYNEIIVIKAVKEEKGVVENLVAELVIETNFRRRAVGGHVFIFGRALSQAEFEKAANFVMGIKAVQLLTNRAKMRSKE